MPVHMRDLEFMSRTGILDLSQFIKIVNQRARSYELAFNTDFVGTESKANKRAQIRTGEKKFNIFFLIKTFESTFEFLS